MPDGGVLEVHAAARPAAALPARTSWAEVRISDTGSGIAQELIDRVFDPFFTTKREGTGLGLTLSHEIVQRHEGEIDLQSVPGQGTVASVRLPLL
jgi:signal transduction histidine kinase